LAGKARGGDVAGFGRQREGQRRRAAGERPPLKGSRGEACRARSSGMEVVANRRGHIFPKVTIAGVELASEQALQWVGGSNGSRDLERLDDDRCVAVARQEPSPISCRSVGSAERRSAPNSSTPAPPPSSPPPTQQPSNGCHASYSGACLDPTPTTTTASALRRLRRLRRRSPLHGHCHRRRPRRVRARP